MRRRSHLMSRNICLNTNQSTWPGQKLRCLMRDSSGSGWRGTPRCTRCMSPATASTFSITYSPRTGAFRPTPLDPSGGQNKWKKIMQNSTNLLKRLVYDLIFNKKRLQSILFLQLSAHYNADPYDMLSKLKKMNLKHVKVASKITKTSSNEKTKAKS